MKCQWKQCESDAAMVEGVDGRPVIALCYPHEWEFMRRVGEQVSEAERIEGWGKFCAERGYDPDATTFEAADIGGDAE